MGSSNQKSVFVTFAIAVCKIPFRKKPFHTEIAKIAKQPTDKPIDGVIQSKIGLCSFVISVCKFRSEKPFHTEIAKTAKQPTDKRINGVIQSKSVFVTFAISVCKISFRKDVPHGDREDR
jgi:hypothetical protein